MAKKIYEEINTVITEDGEILQTTSKIVRKTKSDDFMQVYLNDMSGLMRIRNKSELRILVKLWEIAKFDTNQVILVKAVKSEIAKSLKLAYKTVDNTISKLHKDGILLRKDTSMYFLNPKYFFKGYQENRPRVLKMILEYQIDQEEI